MSTVHCVRREFRVVAKILRGGDVIHCQKTDKQASLYYARFLLNGSEISCTQKSTSGLNSETKLMYSYQANGENSGIDSPSSEIDKLQRNSRDGLLFHK